MNRPARRCALVLFLLVALPAVGDEQFFDSDGVRIRYLDLGPRGGEPVVLVHGGFQNAESWIESGLVDALDDVFRIIAPDMRGHGKSDKPHDAGAYGNAFVEDVVRLLDHLGIEKAHAVGYSMGGRIVFKLVADHPERVISATPSGTSAELAPELQEALEHLVTSLEKSGSIGPILEHFNVDGAMTEEEIEQAVESIRSRNDMEALAIAMRTFPEVVPERSKLEVNPVPSLCVIGEHDTNRPALETTTSYMRNLEVEVIEGVNHLTAWLTPEFNAATKGFLEKHSDRSEKGP